MTIPLTTKIFLAGRFGMVGSAIWDELERLGYKQLSGPGHSELDLTDRKSTFTALERFQPDIVIDAAARVGGIVANSTYPADFISQNLQIQVNLFDACNAIEVPRLLFLGSSCIYPKFASQPIKESELLSGKLEKTNDAYAIAKIAGVMQIEAIRNQYGRHWISAMPTNLYGPRDSFHPENSHVLPGLMLRFHEAKVRGIDEVVVWGSGNPRREFLHVSDLAKACMFLLSEYDEPMPINVGTGSDISIRDLATLVAEIVGFKGKILQDTSKPDGTPQKLLDVSRIESLGWRATIGLREGIEDTYKWFLKNLG